MKRHLFALGALAWMAGAAAPAVAQDREIGRQGATQLSFQAVVTGSQAASDFQGFYFGAWDIGYFTSEHLVLRVGNQFQGAFNSGANQPSLSTNVGSTYYFSPHTPTSFYTSGIYSFRLTNRSEGDRGDLVGSIGVQAAVRSNASVFFEGGYGRSLSSGGSGVLLSSVGLRVLF